MMHNLLSPKTARACLMAAFAAGAVWAGPKIEVDNVDFDAGKIREGSIKKIVHVFDIKNTGDAPLKLTDVRAG